jgi:hypothetical protein
LVRTIEFAESRQKRDQNELITSLLAEIRRLQNSTKNNLEQLGAPTPDPSASTSQE